MSTIETDAVRGSEKLSEQYQLFKSDTCGFCFRVRAYVEQLGIELPLRDVHTDAEAFRELLQGAVKQPCHACVSRGQRIQEPKSSGCMSP